MFTSQPRAPVVTRYLLTLTYHTHAQDYSGHTFLNLPLERTSTAPCGIRNISGDISNSFSSSAMYTWFLTLTKQCQSYPCLDFICIFKYVKIHSGYGIHITKLLSKQIFSLSQNPKRELKAYDSLITKVIGYKQKNHEIWVGEDKINPAPSRRLLLNKGMSLAGKSIQLGIIIENK